MILNIDGALGLFDETTKALAEWVNERMVLYRYAQPHGWGVDPLDNKTNDERKFFESCAAWEAMKKLLVEIGLENEAEVIEKKHEWHLPPYPQKEGWAGIRPRGSDCLGGGETCHGQCHAFDPQPRR